MLKFSFVQIFFRTFNTKYNFELLITNMEFNLKLTLWRLHFTEICVNIILEYQHGVNKYLR